MGLRDQVIKGGAYLSARLALGTVIGIGGVLLLTRAIGPESYGTYAAAFSIYYFVFGLANGGIGIYLIRKKGDIKEEEYHQAFSIYIILGVGGALLSVLLFPILANWIKIDKLEAVASVIFLILPVSLISLLITAKLERSLNYKQIAIIELIGQVIYYIIALPLAFMRLGVWAPTIGLWGKELVSLYLLFQRTRYRPRLYWNRSLAKQMANYGISYSASICIWQLRSLINPLIVGRFLGAAAVGQVALTIKLVENLSFVKSSTWRLSIAALAKVQGDKSRLSKAISQGMQLQLLALGPLLFIFVLVSPWILPLLFGQKWLPVVNLFPFIALSYLVNAFFNLHSSCLYVLNHNINVAVFHLIHISLFAISTIIFVNHYALLGYGWGEVVALPGYVILLIFISKYVGRVEYFKSIIWLISFSAALFIWKIGIFLFFPLLIAIILYGEGTFKEINELIGIKKLKSLEG